MKNNWGKAGAYTGLAFIMPVTIYVCYLIGAWVDHKLGTNIFYLAGIMLGLAGGLYETMRQVNRIERGSRD